jgi:hypothetical protein
MKVFDLFLQNRVICCIFCIWLAACLFALGLMFVYSGNPGASARISSDWPANTHIARAGRYELVLFAHPRCPCTRASLNELMQILSQSGNVNADVVFIADKDDSNWSQTDIWKQACQLPRTRVTTDTTGSETRAFGAKTSGQVYLYDEGGRLLFEGGITAARGHEGDNAGVDSIVALLRNQHAGLSKSNVFGCSLL